MKKIVNKSLQWFGSLSFAVSILSVLVITLMVATFFESYFGTAAAHYSIYKTWGFMGLLFFVGVSVFCAALKKYPWKQHQTGFLITHIGIIVLIVGSYITFQFGIDGNIALQDGESGGSLNLTDDTVEIAIPSQNLLLSQHFNVGPYNRNERFLSFQLPSAIGVYVDQFLPFARREESYIPAETGKQSVIKIRLHNAFVNINPWVIDEVKLGPATVTVKKIENDTALKAFFSVSQRGNFLGNITLLQDGNKWTVPLSEKDLGKVISIPGSPFQIKNAIYYSDAIVEKLKLKNKSRGVHNPALQLTLVGPKGEERHVAFAYFPDFPSTHEKTSLYGAKIEFVSSHMLKAGGENKLEIGIFQGKKLYYRVLSANQNARVGEITVGKSYETGWMNLQFEIETFYPHALKKVQYFPALVKDPNNPKVPKAIRLAFFRAGDKDPSLIEWLEIFDEKNIFFEGKNYRLRFQPKQYSLPFTLHLNHFEMGKDPGTDDPAFYQSDVEVRDGDEHHAVISMNEPLTYKNFTFYQASYQTDEEGKAIGSIFSVGYDPGRMVKYSGSILIVLGILGMFFYRRTYFKSFKDYLGKKKLTSGLMLIFTLASLMGGLGKSEATPHRSLSFEAFKTVPIQAGGRIKPLDTFAREVVQATVGKSTFEGISAIDLVFSWMIFPQEWAETEFIKISSPDIKKKLGLNINQIFFSPVQVLSISTLTELFTAVHEKKNRDEKLTAFDHSIENLEMELMVVDRTSRGELITLIPNPYHYEQNWFSIAQLLSEAGLFSDIQAHHDFSMRADELKTTLLGLFQSYRDQDEKTFDLTTKKLKQLLKEFSEGDTLSSKTNYPFITTLSKEVFYNECRPFRWAWIGYVLSSIFFLLYFIFSKKDIFRLAALGSTGLSFLIHIFGFYLRCSITGRPPVGNMYESVVWVSLGVVFFAYLLFLKYKHALILAAAVSVSAIGLILTDYLPVVLDPTIRPLTPVLRSNYWLTIHVLTITLSYAAFALAMGIGNVALFQYWRGKKEQMEISRLTPFIYQAIQIGVLLLAAGTILGGVWADYSWGRFWGWDPKEVWALIALLCYLIIVHGRYAGWIRDFGMAAGAVLAFQGVLMAWYGVNFVLGVGLHSYGFGSGGLLYVLGYVVFQVVFIFLAYKSFNFLKNH